MDRFCLGDLRLVSGEDKGEVQEGGNIIVPSPSRVIFVMTLSSIVAAAPLKEVHHRRSGRINLFI
jgi:hypothetical protein